MPFKLRNRLRFGPVQINLSQGRWTSTTFRLGRWSWNTRTRRWTFDTPGPGYWQSDSKR